MKSKQKDIAFSCITVFIMSAFILGLFEGQKDRTDVLHILLCRCIYSTWYMIGFVMLMVLRGYWGKLVAFLMFMGGGVMLFLSIFANSKLFITFIAFNLVLTTILIDKIKQK